jgi:transcriptional regulator with XRE-family HTH domain
MTNEQLLDIGGRLREARQQRQLSLRELAARADVSPSLLSQIENGRSNPSVMTLHNVATAMDVPITYFFPQADASVQGLEQALVIRRDTTASELRSDSEGKLHVVARDTPSPVLQAELRAAIELMNGVRWERLTPAEEDSIQFLEICYRPGASSGPALSRHPGREFGLMLAGEIQLDLGFERHSLFAGDSIIFDSNTPHRLYNEGIDDARAVWIVMKRDNDA